MSTILVVEDAPDIVELVRMYLSREGYQLHFASDGVEALEQVRKVSPDVILLDLTLPKLDGLSVCREIRKTRNVPIIIISARGEPVDKVLGLELGADDYLAKPFDPNELVARVRAVLRRRAPVVSEPADEVLERRGLRLRVNALTVEFGGVKVPLTRIEFQLLHVLMQNAGLVLSRDQLLDKVWGMEFTGDARTVDVHVRHLRAKLKEVAGAQNFVSTVWGAGYRFEV